MQVKIKNRLATVADGSKHAVFYNIARYQFLDHIFIVSYARNDYGKYSKTQWLNSHHCYQKCAKLGVSGDSEKGGPASRGEVSWPGHNHPVTWRSLNGEGSRKKAALKLSLLMSWDLLQ